MPRSFKPNGSPATAKSPGRLVILALGVIVLILVSLVGLNGCSSGNSPFTKPNTTASPTTAFYPPEVLFTIDKVTLSSAGFNLAVQVRLINPAIANLNVDSFRVSVVSDGGQTYGPSSFQGGQVDSGSSRIFKGDIVLPAGAVKEKTLDCTLEATGVIETARLPIKSSTSYKVPDLSRLIPPPKVVLEPTMGKLVIDNKLNKFSAHLDGGITSTIPFRVDIGAIQFTVKGRSGNEYFSDLIQGGSLDPDNTLKFSSEIMMPVQALNEGGLTMMIETVAVTEKVSLPIKASIPVVVPTLKDLIIVPTLSIDTTDIQSRWIKVDTKMVFQLLITAEIQNDNGFPLSVGDTHVYFYKPNAPSTSSPLMSTTLPASLYYLGLPPQQITSICNQWIALDYTQIGGPLGGDSLLIVDTRIGINGLNEKIPLSKKTTIPVKSQWAP